MASVSSPPGFYSCSICGSKFPTLQALGGHKSAHSAKRKATAAARRAAALGAELQQQQQHSGGLYSPEMLYSLESLESEQQLQEAKRRRQNYSSSSSSSFLSSLLPQFNASLLSNAQAYAQSSTPSMSLLLEAGHLLHPLPPLPHLPPTFPTEGSFAPSAPPRFADSLGAPQSSILLQSRMLVQQLPLYTGFAAPSASATLLPDAMFPLGMAQPQTNTNTTTNTITNTSTNHRAWSHASSRPGRVPSAVQEAAMKLLSLTNNSMVAASLQPLFEPSRLASYSAPQVGLTPHDVSSVTSSLGGLPLARDPSASSSFLSSLTAPATTAAGFPGFLQAEAPEVPEVPVSLQANQLEQEEDNLSSNFGSFRTEPSSSHESFSKPLVACLGANGSAESLSSTGLRVDAKAAVHYEATYQSERDTQECDLSLKLGW